MARHQRHPGFQRGRLEIEGRGSHLRLVEVLVRDEGGTEWSEPGRGEGWEVSQEVGVASEDSV